MAWQRCLLSPYKELGLNMEMQRSTLHLAVEHAGSADQGLSAMMASVGLKILGPQLCTCRPRCCPLSPHPLTGVLRLQLKSSWAVHLQGMPAKP